MTKTDTNYRTFYSADLRADQWDMIVMAIKRLRDLTECCSDLAITYTHKRCKALLDDIGAQIPGVEE